MTYNKLIIYLSVILIILGIIYPYETMGQSVTLRIGTTSAPPFSFRDANGGWQGFTFDMLDYMIADGLIINNTHITNYNVTTIRRSHDEGFGALRDGIIDIWAAETTITSSREQKGVDFTHSFFKSSLSIMTHNNQSPEDAAKLFLETVFSARSGLTYLIVTTVLICIACIIWVLEMIGTKEIREAHKKYFDHRWFVGIPQALFWSIQSLISDSYTKKPRHPASQYVSTILGILTIFTGAALTAVITAGLLAKPTSTIIQGPSDLPGNTVAVITGTTADNWVKSQGSVGRKSYGSLSEAFKGLEKKEVAAFVYDTPILLFEQKQRETRGDSSLVVVGSKFTEQLYGLVLKESEPDKPPNSLKEPLNRLITKYVDSGDFDRNYNKYFLVSSSGVNVEEFTITSMQIIILVVVVAVALGGAIYTGRRVNLEDTEDEIDNYITNKRLLHVDKITTSDMSRVFVNLIDSNLALTRMIFDLNNEDQYFSGEPVKVSELNDLLNGIKNTKNDFLKSVSTWQSTADLELQRRRAEAGMNPNGTTSTTSTSTTRDENV